MLRQRVRALLPQDHSWYPHGVKGWLVFMLQPEKSILRQLTVHDFGPRSATIFERFADEFQPYGFADRKAFCFFLPIRAGTTCPQVRAPADPLTDRYRMTRPARTGGKKINGSSDQTEFDGVLNGPAVLGTDETVHGMTATVAAARPDVVAVVDATGETTYAELVRVAGAITARLRGLGVGPGDVIAIRIPRGALLFAAELGVLAAGACYLPLDPADPTERHRWIVADAEPAVVLTPIDAPAESDASAGIDRVHRLDASWVTPDVGTRPAAAHEDPDADAYLLYTSGSTGRPKGVAMRHRSLVNMLRWHGRVRPGADRARTLQACSVSFDFSFHEIYSALCLGGTLVVVDDDRKRDPYALASFAVEQRVERVFLPVPALVQFAEAAAELPEPPPLRHVVTTGEQMRLSDPMRALARRTDARWHNHYGATEFQDATVATLPADVAAWPLVAPIGLPIDNVRVALTDEHGVPVAPGEPGELHVGGAGVAAGYRNRPELTAERFVALPGLPGRWYRTGDLARSTGAGLEHLGRVDEQLKVNGVRIEPAEIEAAACGHPGVRQAAAVMHLIDGRSRLIVHIVVRSTADPAEVLREVPGVIAARLPAAVRPHGLALETEIPLTSSGKSARARLTAPPPERLVPASMPAASTTPSRGELERWLVALWRDELGLGTVGVRDNFFDLGGSSMQLLNLRRRITDELHLQVGVNTLVECPTIRSLAERLGHTAEPGADQGNGGRVATGRPGAGRLRNDDRVAIVGMAGRFPAAPNLATFWRNLVDGVDSVTELTDNDLRTQDPALLADPDFVRVAGVLADPDCFDAAYFGINAKEAALMDPQHRIFLECAVDAFEDACEVPAGTRTGVYASSSISTYLVNNLVPHFGYAPDRPFTEADTQQFMLKLGNDRNYLPTRVSYRLDLTGPSMSVQSACSSSLVAVHLARRALLDGECDMAIAGGVSIVVPQGAGYLWEDGLIRSRDGRSRVFDAAASGTLFSSGCGVVLLKRLSAAIADGNRIYAVVAGSAVNNDGSDKLGFTAPSTVRQAEVVVAALADADVAAGDIGYVEAHGTGTQLGDPIEIAGLDQALRASGGAPPPGGVALGSVKSNIGHLDEAAGIAGLIKAALAVHHGVLPASLHYETPNPQIDFAASALRVQTTTEAWPAGRRRIAAVSSHGMGGTNSHVVLAQAPEPARPELDDAEDDAALPVVLPISARDPEAAADLAARYRALLAGGGASLPAVARAAALGRTHHPCRVAVLAAGASEAVTALDAAAIAAPRPGHGGVAFVFAGQGSQWVGMGKALYAAFPLFRGVLDECAGIVGTITGTDLLAVVFDASGGELDRTVWAQPALFTVEYALARLWQSWGVRPDVVLGHSVGEFVAACIAGVLSLRDALGLVVARGRLMDALPDGGAMLSLAVPHEDVAGMLAETGIDVSVAAVNSSSSVVLSGAGPQIAAARSEAERRGWTTSALRVSHAFHSALMEPALEDFRAVAGRVTHHLPEVPVIGNRTGDVVSVFDADHWVRHARESVQFARSIDRAVTDHAVSTIVEVSPKPTLLRFAARDGVHVLPTLRPGGEVQQILDSLRLLYLAGHDIDWLGVYHGERAAVMRLPAYPWRRTHHWIEPRSRPVAARSSGTFLGMRVEQPGSAEVRFVSQIDPGHPQWLTQHRIFGRVVLPGVAYQDLAFSAAAEIGVRRPALDDFLIHQAMRFTHDAEVRDLHVVLRPAPDGGAIEIHSRPAEGTEPWTLHATGTVSEGDAVPAVATETLRARFGEPVSPDEIYRGEHGRSIDLGDWFRVTEGLWRAGEAACLSRIALPPRVTAGAGRHAMHPILLEACLLALTVTYPSAFAERSYVPVGAQRVTLHNTAGVTEAWCMAELRPTDDPDPRTLVGDITLYADDGQVLVVMAGVLLRQASAEGMAGEAMSRRRRLLYRSAWVPTPAPEPSFGGSWVVVGDALARSIADAARHRGVACRVVEPGGLAAAVAQERADVVVLAWPAEHPGPGTDAGDAKDLALAVLENLRTLQELPVPPRPVLLTSQAHGGVPRPAQTSLWGLARVFGQEHPDRMPALVDLPAAGVAPAMIVAEVAGGSTDEVALDAEVRRVLRLRPDADRPDELELHPAGTHLVTGGLGGLGLEVAAYLVAAGARHLALLSRHDPDERARARIAALTALDVQVRTFAADVTDAGQVLDVLADVERTMPPLTGVYHLAGALADGLVATQTPRRFADAWDAKAVGAKVLHETTAHLPLEHFVLFSSMSGLFGTAGQANYAAANAYLDGLAGARRAMRLPAISIQWASWAEAGMTARAGLEERLQRLGERALSVGEATTALGKLLAQPPENGVIAVLGHDWARFAAHHAALPSPVRELVPACTAERLEPSAGAVRLREAAPGFRPMLAEELVHDLAAEVLGVPKMAGDAGFFSLGMDSLASLELRNRLQSEFGVRFGQTVVFDHPTVAGLASHVLDALDLGPREPDAVPARPEQEDEQSIDEVVRALTERLESS